MRSTDRARRRRWAAVAALAVVAGTATASPAAPAGAAASGTLAGTTSITWTGSAGFRLRVPRDVSLPAGWASTRLFVTGGTYAFVRMWAPGFCPADVTPHCTTFSLTYTKELADSAFFGADWRNKFGPGTDHWRELGTPPGLVGRTYELYLMTDGRATVELHPPELRGRTGYTATGRIAAQVRRLGADCGVATTVGIAACDPASGYGDRLRFGGAAAEPGGLGQVESIAYTASRFTGDSTAAQPRMLRACVYPNGFDTAASPDPAAHPTGCDVVSGSQRGQFQSVVETSNEAASLTSPRLLGIYTSAYNPEVRGRGYAGYRITTVADVPPPEFRAAYGIWFAYGIR